jgi:hypothetical protein
MSDSGQQIRTFWELEADRIIDKIYIQSSWESWLREDAYEILAYELRKSYERGKDSCSDE